MTERDKSLNCRKVRMGRFVEAHMALICGKVITWFVGCRLELYSLARKQHAWDANPRMDTGAKGALYADAT
jgi:hypothetical protein